MERNKLTRCDPDLLDRLALAQLPRKSMFPPAIPNNKDPEAHCMYVWVFWDAENQQGRCLLPIDKTPLNFFSYLSKSKAI